APRGAGAEDAPAATPKRFPPVCVHGFSRPRLRGLDSPAADAYDWLRLPINPKVQIVMSSTAGKGYLVRRLQEAPTVRGQSTRPLTFPDTTVCNLHVTFIKDSAK